MPKKFKVLLSAYACEPNKGSEPGIGWNWAIEIAKRGHNVIVLTRRNNRAVIEQESDVPINLSFIYYDLPDKLMGLKKIFGVHLYYFLWQLGTYFFIKKQIKYLSLNFIHHITFGNIRKYSILSFLNIPFYYGPNGGGENCPSNLLKEVSLKNKTKEFVRNGLNKGVRYNPLSNIIFDRALKIFTATEQSSYYINKRFKAKITNASAIGITVNQTSNNLLKKDNTTIQLLYVGRFIYWKGLHICFDALKLLNDKGINFKLTLVGKGSEEKMLRNKIKSLKLDTCVEWINWLPQEELAEVYTRNDLFVFPSLHDSGGMVVLEAMSLGLPVVCLDIGGPGYLVTEDVGSKIPVVNKSYNEVVEAYANAIIVLAKDQQLLKEKSLNAQQIVLDYSWENTVEKVYSIIEDDFNSLTKK